MSMLKSPYNISPDISFAEAAKIALATQSQELRANIGGTKQGDVESLHDMRVASRRLRAAMSVFASAFPPAQFRPLEKEASRITDALGAVRDADVQIEYLVALRDAAPVIEKVGLDALIAHISERRDRDRAELRKELDRFSAGAFVRDMESLTGHIELDGRDPEDG